jgi:epoxyqueuosine reductase
LDALIDRLAVLEPSARARGVVDTAPLLERDFARLAGLGWVGKNTLLLNRNAGSWFFLAALIVDIELDHDAPYTADHCGTCRACLEACPTDAFPQPYVLDATRCISYLTIESRELPPAELRKLTGDWVFGCDVCQDVCPWNRRREGRDAPDFRPDDSLNPFDLMSLFFQDDEQFRKRFRPTPLWRPKRRGMLRNAAIVLGNQRHPAAIPALAHGLRDPEPLVRATCAWALGQFALPDAQLALEQARTGESDGRVLAEIQISLHSVDHAKDPFAAIHRSTDSDRT